MLRVRGPDIESGGEIISVVFLSASKAVTRMGSHSLTFSYPHTVASTGARAIFTALAIVASPSPNSLQQVIEDHCKWKGAEA